MIFVESCFHATSDRYDSIARQLPEEFAARAADKLHYRYPRGESYMDVIQRLEVCIDTILKHTTITLFFNHT
jgi:broad specificity phosphatase PhoE